MIIYKATNKINGKCFIGKTSSTLAQVRTFYKHMATRFDKPNSYMLFVQAIRKYGIENFDFEIIFKTSFESEAKKFHADFIKIFNAVEHGYNSDFYRRGGPKTEIDVYTMDGKFLTTYESQNEASRMLGVDVSAINAILNKNILLHSIHGYRFTYHGELLQIPEARADCKKKVICMKPDGTDLMEFRSITEASKITNTVANQIIHVCKGRKKTYKGLVWQYKEEV